MCTHVFSYRLVSEGACEALLFVAIVEQVLRFMVKSEAENNMVAEFFWTSNSGASLCGDE
jgi:hypothetical protein